MKMTQIVASRFEDLVVEVAFIPGAQDSTTIFNVKNVVDDTSMIIVTVDGIRKELFAHVDNQKTMIEYPHPDDIETMVNDGGWQGYLSTHPNIDAFMTENLVAAMPHVLEGATNGFRGICRQFPDIDIQGMVKCVADLHHNHFLKSILMMDAAHKETVKRAFSAWRDSTVAAH